MKYKRQKFKRVQISKDVILKSGLEVVIYKYLNSNNLKFTYEGTKITYFQPAIKKTYTPDFPLEGSFIVETKGAFNSADRKKMRLIKTQNPKLDIRFVFSNAQTKIGKKSKTTYAKWCTMFGFPFHCIQSTKQNFPSKWLEEIKNHQKDLNSK